MCHSGTGNRRQSQRSRHPSNKNGKGKSLQPPIKILESRAWQGAGAAGRQTDSQPGLLRGKLGKVAAAEALEVGASQRSSVSPPGPPARLPTGHVRPLPQRGPRSAQLSSTEVPRRSHSKKSHLHLESLMFFPLKPDSFEATRTARESWI